MRIRSQRLTSGADGFSLLELLVVVGIVLVVGALAMPTINSGITSYRLRASSIELAGMLQQVRIAAVRSNNPVELRYLMVQGGTRQQIYADINADGQLNAGEPVTIFPQAMSIQTAGFPGDAYAVAAPGMTAQAQGTAVKFNSRGLPCLVTAGICKNLTPAGTQVGFVYYLRANPTLGNSAWAAVTITPAGRIKSWYYSGGTYK